ncbi:histidine phosphatase family protein [Vibrio sp. 10N]|uniref:histidine phosphatase family protein n=1 Tax=Vibrio sp. 10N TaxID=3058938 RepID=UPI0028132535|nr:alpha-ribazole phosphatase [Vibrio sp. 10N]
MKVNLLLLRHAKVQGAAALYGHTDVGVEAELSHQALQSLLSIQTEINRVVSSPLSRCTSLARPFAVRADVELTIEPALAEMDFGDFDGVPFDSMSSQQWQKLEPFWSAPATCVLPNAESLEDFHLRIRQAWQRITQIPQHTLVVCHGGVIRQILADVLGLDWRNPKLYAGLTIGNATITQLQFDSRYPESIHVKVIGQPIKHFQLIP